MRTPNRRVPCQLGGEFSLATKGPLFRRDAIAISYIAAPAEHRGLISRPTIRVAFQSPFQCGFSKRLALRNDRLPRSAQRVVQLSDNSPPLPEAFECRPTARGRFTVVMLHNRRTRATAACSGAICRLRRELCQRLVPPARTGRDGQPGKMDDASEGFAQTAEHLSAKPLLRIALERSVSRSTWWRLIARAHPSRVCRTFRPRASYAVLGAKQAAKPAYGRVSFDVENGRR